MLKEEDKKEEKKEKFLWAGEPIKVPTGPRGPDGKEGGDPDFFLQITNFVVDQINCSSCQRLSCVNLAKPLCRPFLLFQCLPTLQIFYNSSLCIGRLVGQNYSL